MRVLFVGNLYSGSNARSLALGFESAGHEVRSIDTTRWTSPRVFSKPWLDLQRTGKVSRDVNLTVARRIRDLTVGWTPDLVLCVKTIRFDQRVLLSAPGRYRVHYSADDVSNPSNVSADYLLRERDWDLVVTTKRHNVEELGARGVGRVLFVWSAYDPTIHHGPAADVGRRYLVGFIGAMRPDRVDLPRTLAGTVPHRGLVRGPRWRRRYPTGSRGVTIGGTVPGTEYAAVSAQVFASPILLNSDNRDLHTCRSLEAPACGNLALAPRTDEHQLLLDDGTECLMHGSDEELTENMRRVAGDGRRLAGVASAGRRRILAGNHTYADRAREIIAAL